MTTEWMDRKSGSNEEGGYDWKAANHARVPGLRRVIRSWAQCQTTVYTLDLREISEEEALKLIAAAKK